MGLQSKSIPIKGMHCKACTVMVADELSKIPGVKRASVSLKTNTAIIRYTDEPTDAQIERAIDEAGYIVGIERKTFFSKDKSVYSQFVLSIAWIVILYLIIKS